MGVKSEEFIPITRTALQALTWSPLTKLFAEGMRATQPKSKFLFWFVILEELESRDEFKPMFTPLFSENEKKSLRQAALSPEAKQRLEGLLTNPLATQQGRPEKLLAILRKIGLGTVKTISRETMLDESICRSLIKQRNNIAHRLQHRRRRALHRAFPIGASGLELSSKAIALNAGRTAASIRVRLRARIAISTSWLRV
jgi:hypothetical protein